MKLSEIIDVLNAEVMTGQAKEQLDEVEINIACGSDLMSDVLAFVKEQVMLLTGLVNPQVVRTAEMMDISAICFVRGKKPNDAIISLAKDCGLVIIATDYPLYIACGKLYAGGLVGEGA